MDNIFNDDEVADLLREFKNGVPQLSEERLELSKSNSDMVTEVLDKLLIKFNEKHNLHLKVNFKDLFSNLEVLQEGNNLRYLELYISDLWSTFKVAFFIRILQSLMILANKISDPARLTDISNSLESDFALVDKLFDFINKISILGRDIGIFDVNSELTRLHKIDEAKNRELDRNNPEVMKILDELRKSLGYGN